MLVAVGPANRLQVVVVVAGTESCIATPHQGHVDRTWQAVLLLPYALFTRRLRPLDCTVPAIEEAIPEKTSLRRMHYHLRVSNKKGNLLLGTGPKGSL